MGTASEQARLLVAALTSALPHAEVIDDCAAKRVEAERELSGVLKELHDARGQLAKIEAALVKANENHAARLEEIRNEEAKAVQEMNRQTAAAQQDLERVTTNVAEVQARHNAVLAGMAALHQRLGGAER
jgi:Skp family chaperone for outer membrane proteins